MTGRFFIVCLVVLVCFFFRVCDYLPGHVCIDVNWNGIMPEKLRMQSGDGGEIMEEKILKNKERTMIRNIGR